MLDPVNPPKLIFATLLVMALIVVGIILAPGAEIAAHIDHSRVGAMFSGGDGAARHASTATLGWAFGAIQLLLFASLMALGVQRNGSLRGFGPPLLGCTALLLTLRRNREIRSEGSVVGCRAFGRRELDRRLTGLPSCGSSSGG